MNVYTLGRPERLSARIFDSTRIFDSNGMVVSIYDCAMAWIDDINYAQATGPLRQVYDDIRGAQNGTPPYPISTIFGLRPEVLASQDRFKRTFLQDASTLGRRKADYIAVAVSGLNHCRF